MGDGEGASIIARAIGTDSCSTSRDGHDDLIALLDIYPSGYSDCAAVASTQIFVAAPAAAACTGGTDAKLALGDGYYSFAAGDKFKAPPQCWATAVNV